MSKTMSLPAPLHHSSQYLCKTHANRTTSATHRRDRTHSLAERQAHHLTRPYITSGISILQTKQ